MTRVDSPRIDRRAAVGKLCGLAAAPSLCAAAAEEESSSTGLGLVIYCCGIRRRWMQRERPDFDLFEPQNFLEHCRSVGAGGMQVRLGALDEKAAARLREYAAEHSLFIEASVSPPGDKTDLDRFGEEIRTAAAAGALAARTVIIPGRRYERFKTLAEFREFERRGRRMLELAAPVAEKHRIPLAVENHKDQRIDERIALFKHISSEYVGACVDTGNSFALLEDPLETVAALARWAKAVHLKDQAVREYDDGFLLGDIPLGEGCFDLKKMVEILRKAKPDIRFALELITRDPLQVPCLTGAYYSTMPDLPARDLARTLRIVRQHPADNLQQVSSLPLDKQIELEDANVAASLKYADERLLI